jgi:hypothetical protein
MVDVLQGVTIAMLALAQFHHAWCHLQDAKTRLRNAQSDGLEEDR